MMTFKSCFQHHSQQNRVVVNQGETERRSTAAKMKGDEDNRSPRFIRTRVVRRASGQDEWQEMYEYGSHWFLFEDLRGFAVKDNDGQRKRTVEVGELWRWAFRSEWGCANVNDVIDNQLRAFRENAQTRARPSYTYKDLFEKDLAWLAQTKAEVSSCLPIYSNIFLPYIDWESVPTLSIVLVGTNVLLWPLCLMNELFHCLFPTLFVESQNWKAWELMYLMSTLSAECAKLLLLLDRNSFVSRTQYLNREHRSTSVGQCPVNVKCFSCKDETTGAKIVAVWQSPIASCNPTDSNSLLLHLSIRYGSNRRPSNIIVRILQTTSIAIHWTPCARMFM